MDLQTRQDLEGILGYYHQLPAERTQNVGNGVWAPTHPAILWPEMISLAIWRAREQTPSGGKALVAGSGDGRRAAYLNRLGYDTVGVEFNPALVERSRKILAELSQKGLVNPSRLRIEEGDFLQDDTYRASGTDFGEFNSIFAYLIPGNLTPLFTRFQRESPRGAEFFVLKYMEWPDPTTNLKPVARASIPGIADGIYPIPNHELVRYRKN